MRLNVLIVGHSNIKPVCFVYVSLLRSLKKGSKQPHIRKSGKIKVMGASRMRSLAHKMGEEHPYFGLERNLKCVGFFKL